MSVDKNAGAIDPNTTRDATSTRVVFAPQWLNARPGLDVSMPFGLGYTFTGSRSSAVSGFGVDGGGDFSVGLNLLYECAQTRNVPRREGHYNLSTHLPWHSSSAECYRISVSFRNCLRSATATISRSCS